MKLFAQALAFLSLLLGVAAIGGDGFPPYGAPGDKQCIDIQMVDGLSVKAKCPTYQPDKLYLCSELDLNKCYANQNGVLTPRQDGNFGSSCRNCRLTGTNLQCECVIDPSKPDQTWLSSVDTDNDIENANGNMGCFYRDGFECQM
ncbi:hypothetical protein PG989_006913 [Apiospora arundinis]|uniref:CVNH domain-containing protein n=1 Tax=Apiospora arundinis TaxID=335852 RepID=A0ABR2I8N0_9PEZI